jgi:hypothetical protein
MKTPIIICISTNRMLMPVILLSFFIFSACSNEGKEKANKSLDDFKTYVKEHQESTEKYSEEKWEDIEREYQEKKADLDKKADKMDREMKESYHNAQADWEDFKNDISNRHLVKEQKKQEEKLIHTFAPDHIKADMANITGENIASVYIHFFDVVEKNKEIYSKEEWATVNNYWKKLNDIKDRLDENKAISKSDNRQINEIKLKYGATKAMNKPFAQGAK